jgi:FkbM family methyltransferase
MFHSQDGQDKYLEMHIFKNKKNGTFVDVGAHDGISINNTLYFERYNGWTGINIEPIAEVYDKLVVNRPFCININCAVSNRDGYADFILNNGYTEMLSGLKNSYDYRHIDRLQEENNMTNSTSRIITVCTKRLETIFDEKNIKHVNYVSIDVEGGEFDVIKSINFDKVFIDVIGFENNYNDVSVPIVEYLSSKNFQVCHKSMDIFMINKSSVYYSNIDFVSTV